MNMQLNKEKGLSGILLLLLAVLVVAGVFVYFKKISKLDAVVSPVEVTEVTQPVIETFEALPKEDITTPNEISDDVIAELDDLMLSIDDDDIDEGLGGFE